MADGFAIKLCISGSNISEIFVGNAQDRGARDYQEDSFGYTPLDEANYTGFVAVVADGMGGLAAGDKVSSYSVSEIVKLNTKLTTMQMPFVGFRHTVSELNQKVLDGQTGGGCTLAAVCCSNRGVYWCSVGDSRIYIARDGMIFQLSEDGDYQNRLLDDVIAGELSAEDMLANEKKDSLAEYIGSPTEPYADVNIRPLIPNIGDKILICSDGVYNALSDEEMAHSLSRPASEAAEALIQLIKEKNYENQDNNTAVVLEFQ